MFIEFILLSIGLAVLIYGADLLIKSARSIALTLGIPTIVVGLTIVAFGTSAPELFVSVVAAWRGSSDVAVGNVVGSNIFNVLVIIGLTAVFAPVKVAHSISYRDYPIMLIALGLLLIFSQNGVISRIEGLVLFTAVIIYTLFSYFSINQKSDTIKAALDSEDETTQDSTFKSVALMIIGLIGLGLGAELMVGNAISIARAIGISELVIGVTIIAAGTSLPELATSVIAARQKEPDLVMGNAIGSNIFNVFCVIGLASIITPIIVSTTANQLDIPFMFISCLLVWPIILITHKIGRLFGATLLLTYCLYVALILTKGMV